MIIETREDTVSDESGSGMSVDLSTLRGSRVLNVNHIDADHGYFTREDQSYGSWLEDAGDPALHLSSDLEEYSPCGEYLDDYLVRNTSNRSLSLKQSTQPARPPRSPRAHAPSRSQSTRSQATERIRDQEFFGNTEPSVSHFQTNSSMSSARPTPITTDSVILSKTMSTRPGSEIDAHYDVSPSNGNQTKIDPNSFPDPYPNGMAYHHPPTTTPALSSAGSSSASTRSSAYTNPGSTISGSAFSGDYSHVRVASGDDFDPATMFLNRRPSGAGITADLVVDMLARASTGSSLSSGSRKSHGHIHGSHMPRSRIRRSDITRSSRAPSQSHIQAEDFGAYEVPMMPPQLRSQPSYDTSWQRETENDDFGTSEEDYDYEHPDYDEEEDIPEDEQEPSSAIIIAEEGRGLIVRGEGMSVHSLNVQPGTTHLLVGGSSTPNSVPNFLTNTLPQISSTLLALDISANFLALLSPALALCSCLEELNISANPLRAIPEFLAHMTSLRVLLADSTGISTIPASLSALDKLHTLSIRRNKMHSLPSWLCTLPCLESLLVDGNPFQGPWKALVEPLLAKTPMTPAYPPSTPLVPQLSATFSTSSVATTTVESTDVSDAEDLTDQDEANIQHLAPSLAHPASVPSSSGDSTLEDDTITPAQARILERSATSPPTGFSPPQSRPLSRNRTTPNRSFYERERQLRVEQQPGIPSSPPPSVPLEIIETNDSTPSNSNNLDPQDPTLNPRMELRRMRSADELRRATQPEAIMRAGSSTLAPPTPNSPQRPELFATSSSSSVLTENLNALSPQRRFASLSAHSRTSSRGPTRAQAQSLWTGTPEEESDAEVERNLPQMTMARARAATGVDMSRSSQYNGYERNTRQSLGKGKGEKDKSGRKWGFLKKMSMGKLRPNEDARLPPSAPPSRPSTSLGNVYAGPSMSRPMPAVASTSATPRQLSPPQVEVDPQTTDQSDLPATIGSPPSTFQPLVHKASNDMLRMTPSPAANLLVPPSPLSKSSKRRSFLPIDGPPALNIPIPSTSPFLGGITATNGSDDQEEASRHASPVAESPEDVLRREEDRNREANARALRSVMAYLKDMNDLTLLSQGNTLSMYGGSAPLMERPRRPTLVDGQPRLPSERSMDSIDSASSAPTTVSSHIRSLDSLSGNRSGSLNTLSIATSDSSGSGGEERKCKDDRGKRIMIVREIVETERTYVKNLQDLVNIYVRPAAIPVNSIGNVTASSKETVVPAAERKIVFGGLEALFTFHKESLLPALENAAAPLLSQKGATADTESDGKLSLEVAMNVGRTFIAHAAFMKMYSSYINNFENSVARIKAWAADRSTPSPATTLSPSSSTTHLASLGSMSPSVTANVDTPKNTLSSSQRKRIKAYLKRCRLHRDHSQLNLEGYLLLPVQRVPRYRLLLEDLSRYTPPPADSYDDPLDRAVAEISSLATNMNEGKREAESRRKLVQWQARIRGKFPSPLVQPHRRLIMDGKLLLTRIVRKQTLAFEVFDSHGDASSVAVDCLAPELTPRPLYGILCNDLFVLCRDPSNGQDPNSPVDLWAVLRMQTMPQPTSIVHGNTLRIVDTKAILYLEAPSTSEALTWVRAINMHVSAQKLEA